MSAVNPGNYRAVFRHRAFGLFWGGFSLSLVGDAMTRVAAPGRMPKPYNRLPGQDGRKMI